MAWRGFGFTFGMVALATQAFAAAPSHKSAHQDRPRPPTVTAVNYVGAKPQAPRSALPRQAQGVLRVLAQNGLVPDISRNDQPLREQAACLALTIYHEARGQSQTERIAVAQVVFNRMSDFGGSICSTVWARDGADFQWVKRGLSEILPRETDTWEDMQRLAVGLIRHRPDDITHGATFFYNPSLCTPPWARDGKVTLRLKNVFIRMQPKAS